MGEVRSSSLLWSTNKKAHTCVSFLLLDHKKRLEDVSGRPEDLSMYFWSLGKEIPKRCIETVSFESPTPHQTSLVDMRSRFEKKHKPHLNLL